MTDHFFCICSRFCSVRARVFGASPGVWMLYQVRGCFTRCVDAFPGVWSAGSHAKHSCGTTAMRPRHGVPGNLSLTNVAAAGPWHGTRKSCCSPSLFWWVRWWLPGTRSKSRASRGNEKPPHSTLLGLSQCRPDPAPGGVCGARWWLSLSLSPSFILNSVYVCDCHWDQLCLCLLWTWPSSWTSVLQKANVTNTILRRTGLYLMIHILWLTRWPNGSREAIK